MRASSKKLGFFFFFLLLAHGATALRVARTRRLMAHRAYVVMGDGDISRWFEANVGPAVKQQGSFGGSGWAATSQWICGGKKYFVKTSSKSCASMFAGEAAGLRAMRAGAGAEGLLKIPEIFACADYAQGHGSYLIMEFLSMGSRGDQREFGRALALMHLAAPTAAESPEAAAHKFGFGVDNSCGATPQPNGWMDSWPDFYAERRLKHQLTLAGNGYLDHLGARLLPRIHDFFDDEEVIRPSIIHGDLWSGNIGTADGKPTIFDPACYYAHHEAEWGMSWCAGFSAAFWEGYRDHIPEHPNFKKRRPLYEAYHQLNHYNLFGGSYRNAAASCLEQALKALDDMPRK